MMNEVSQYPTAFRVELPEIYQIEVSSLCNFNCTMCPRTLYTRQHRYLFIEMNTVEKLVKEGAFEGSYFVELQMAGEPTLHPALATIIKLVKSTGVKVGLSTNGSRLSPELFTLDALTISVDTLGGEDVRKGRDRHEFIRSVRRFIHDAYHANKNLFIDLQLIELAESDWSYQLRLAERLFQAELELPTCRIRTVPDCFLTVFQKPSVLPVSRDICLNPWMSVSIQSSGNVVPCCFAFGDDIILGNVRDQTLDEIWHGPTVRTLRREHETKNYRDICARCYMRSPVLLHWNLFLHYRRSEQNAHQRTTGKS